MHGPSPGDSEDDACETTCSRNSGTSPESLRSASLSSLVTLSRASPDGARNNAAQVVHTTPRGARKRGIQRHSLFANAFRFCVSLSLPRLCRIWCTFVGDASVALSEIEKENLVS